MKSSTVGIVILVIGIILLVWGFNEYGTIGSRASRLLGAGIPRKVVFLFIAGAVCTAFGLLKTVRK